MGGSDGGGINSGGIDGYSSNDSCGGGSNDYDDNCDTSDHVAAAD